MIVKEQLYVLAEFERSPLESIRVSVSVFRGKRFVNLRCWFCGEDGEWRPTKRGVVIKESEISRLQRALDLVGGMPVKPLVDEEEEIGA
jgi:hypothetical protein